MGDDIERLLGIDLADTKVRERAWRRIRTFYAIAKGCDDDGNHTLAATLRRICVQATSAPPSELSLALLAGPENEEEGE